MDRIRYAEAMREQARETWGQATQAEIQGDHARARRLIQQAQDAEMRAMSCWPVNLSYSGKSRTRPDPHAA